MGCSTSKANIESEILLLRLMRTEIQDEKKIIIKKLEEITGKKIIRAKIPDYILKDKKNKKSKPKSKKNTKNICIKNQSLKITKKKRLDQKQRTKPDENDESSMNNSKNVILQREVSSIEEIEI